MEDESEDSSNAASQKQKLEILEEKERMAFKNLGVNIRTVANILKDARNIHKTIRDAITEAVVHLEQVQEYRIELAETRSALLRQMEEDIKSSAISDPEPLALKPIPENITVENQLQQDKRRNSENEWRKVEYRKDKKRTGNMNERRVQRTRLPEAVSIKSRNETTYANILRNIKTNIDPSRYGVQFNCIRRTKTGELIMEIKNGSGKTEDLKKEVARLVKEDATVRLMSQTVTLEIRDLDEATDEKEVLDAVQAITGNTEPNSIKIKTIRKCFGETQMAVLTAPAKIADQLIAIRKIKIGWINCRIRERIQITRCFRCLSFGHVASNCTGPDRSKTCRLCGSEGHFSNNCKRVPECILCKEEKIPGGADHILGSFKCELFQRELRKRRNNDQISTN